MQEIISRKEARARGLTRYFTGKPCLRGHISERNVAKKSCLQCHWKPQKQQECNGVFLHIVSRNAAIENGLDRYFNGRPCKHGHLMSRRVDNKCCVECHNSKSRGRKVDPDLARARNRASYEVHGEKIREGARAYRKKNKGLVSVQLRNYRERNPHIVSALKTARRAQKMRAIPSWYGEFDVFIIREALHLSSLREKATGIKWHVDHMIPLKAKNACGLHCSGNIQVIPAFLNIQKHNRMVLTEPLEWLKHI